MISRLLPALFVFGFAGSVFAQDTTSVTTTNPPITSFSEDKPAFLFFKEGTFARDGKHKINVDITLDGKIPNALNDRKVSFYFGFDIDDNGNSGSKSLTAPGLGRDMSVWLIKEEKELRFVASSSSVVDKGKSIDIKVTKLKVDDDKISFQMSSEIFGMYDSMKIYVISGQEFFERKLSKGSTDIDQFPRKGWITLKSERK